MEGFVRLVACSLDYRCNAFFRGYVKCYESGQRRTRRNHLWPLWREIHAQASLAAFLLSGVPVCTLERTESASAYRGWAASEDRGENRCTTGVKAVASSLGAEWLGYSSRAIRTELIRWGNRFVTRRLET